VTLRPAPSRSATNRGSSALHQRLMHPSPGVEPGEVDAGEGMLRRRALPLSHEDSTTPCEGCCRFCSLRNAAR